MTALFLYDRKKNPSFCTDSSKVTTTRHIERMVIYVGQSVGLLKQNLPAGALYCLMMIIIDDVEQEIYLVSLWCHVLVKNKMYSPLYILITKCFCLFTIQMKRKLINSQGSCRSVTLVTLLHKYCNGHYQKKGESP